MISPYVREQIENDSDKFEYRGYKFTIADLRKLNRDVKYTKKHNYIVHSTKTPPIIGFKATKKENSLEKISKE